MQKNDYLLLECTEDIYFAIDNALKKTQGVRSVHIITLEKWAEELRNFRRIFEDVSCPARLIIEHLLECQSKNGQVAFETEYLSQPFSSVALVRVEGFGIIKVRLGELDIAWRDNNYTYYFYPDKIELRNIDEKSAIKLFFSIPFGRQLIEEFPELIKAVNVAYLHPQIEKWIRMV